MFKTISNILVNKTFTINISGLIASDNICHFKYAPITFVNVERSFSMYTFFFQSRKDYWRLKILNYTLLFSSMFNIFKGKIA